MHPSCWALVERLSVGHPHALVVERSHLHLIWCIVLSVSFAAN